MISTAAIMAAVFGFPSHSDYLFWRDRSPGARTTSYIRTHDMSFPGMNDSDTYVTCAAPILVELERSYSMNVPPRFSTLLLDFTDEDARCDGSIGVESWEGGCSLSPGFLESRGGSWEKITVQEWVRHCIPDSLTAFMFWMDHCPASLSWNERSCEETMVPYSDETDSPTETLEERVPLLNGTVMGIVQTCSVKDQPPTRTTILVPDPVALDSCWTVSCGWDYEVSTEDCIRHATNHLHHVSLDQYAKTVWPADCD